MTHTKEPKGKELLDKQKIMEQAIERALDNGWTAWGYKTMTTDWDWWVMFGGTLMTYSSASREFSYRPEEIIFDHEFAKALWGEDREAYLVNVNTPFEAWEQMEEPAWRFHLKRMVLAESPLTYLAANLKEAR